MLLFMVIPCFTFYGLHSLWMWNNSLGIVTIIMQHHRLSLGREEICGLYLNTLRTVGLTYSYVQFHEDLQRIIRQNRIYLFLQPVQDYFIIFFFTSLGTDPRLLEHELWYTHLVERQFRCVLVIQKMPLYMCTFELCYRCWYKSIPKL